MSWDEDEYEDKSYYYLQEAAEDIAREALFEEHLRSITQGAVFDYLATHGDAIEARVQRCLAEAEALAHDGYYGAALTCAVSGIEVTIRFFLLHPLVQGAFLSADWAAVLSQKVLNGRTADERKLLPAILRKWEIDITQVILADGSQAWEQTIGRVWGRRNHYVHKADEVSAQDAALSIECLTTLLTRVVDPLATMLGFTREQTGSWSVVAAKNPDLNPPTTYPRHDPFNPLEAEPPQC
jgi:hypothetical protein